MIGCNRSLIDLIDRNMFFCKIEDVYKRQVIAILAILAGFLAAAYVKHLKEARAAVCLENRDRLYKEMNAKYADGTYDSLKEAYNKLMENYKDRKLCPSKGTYSWEANGDGINQIVCSVHGAPSDLSLIHI